MSIKFTEIEVKQFPLLEKIKVGMNVLGLSNSDYDRLKGVITEIKYGNEKETENETVLDISVDFEENEYLSIERTHPHLNGTGISQVICGEDELGFLLNDESNLYISIEGKVICPHCYTPLEKVNETQSTDISWVFENGEYVKKEGFGDSSGKRCDVCDGEIEDPSEKVFVY